MKRCYYGKSRDASLAANAAAAQTGPADVEQQRGVMKIPTAGFSDAAGIISRVADKAGVSDYETIETMKGMEQLALP